MPLAPLLVLTATALCSVALARGPVARFCQEYLRTLGSGEPEAAPPLCEGHPTRYWLVSRTTLTAVTALECLVCGAWALGHGRWLEGVVVMPLLVPLLAATLTDAACHRLPNRLLGGAALWSLGTTAGLGLLSLVQGASLKVSLAPLATGLLMASALGAGFLALALLPAGLGLGDVKLSAVIGLWLGSLGRQVALYGVLAGLVAAGLAAVALIVTGRVRRRQALALGPYLLAGACLAWAEALT